MLGAIIGDIVGSRFEFNPTNDYNFELFTDECSFTDDTICTIAVADALLKGIDYGEAIHEWCRRYPHPMGGYGGNFRKWVESDNPRPYGSYGNGSAMRVSPIGWWFSQPGDLIGEAKKSAECTHSHPEGIDGAIAVVAAVNDCRELRRCRKRQTETSGRPLPVLTPDDILWGGLDHAVMIYAQFPQLFNINLDDYRNRFDETCRGTVPPALWIVMHSTGFEDAIRRAVSLGADADTLGAIVGGIAEALWGIPEWIKQKALTYLPDDMKAVLDEFRNRLKRLELLAARCEYFKAGEHSHVPETALPVLDIEKEWAHDLARSYSHADAMKTAMAKRFPMEKWQDLADDYDLPLSLVGYIARGVLTPRHKTTRCLEKYLDTHYARRKPAAAEKKARKQAMEQAKAAMLWKLGLGNMARLMMGENPMPDKSKTATADMWQTEPMPADVATSEVALDIHVSADDMAILRKGHIPEAMEDHWFMYCDDSYIRYFRSWTGICVFEAHFTPSADGYVVDRLLMSQVLCEFGVNGTEAGEALFRYLLTAETGGDAAAAWQRYLAVWQRLLQMYSN